MRRRHLVAAVGTVAMGLSVLPLVATPAAAVSAPVVVADGLDGPYKLTFGPDGDLYVAESGRAGDENCVSDTDEGGETVETCYGATGAITRVDLDGDAPTQEQVVTGLPSIGDDEVAIGPVDVAFSPVGQMHVITGLGGDEEFRDQFGDPRAGGVLRVDALGESTVLSDLVAYEQDNNPDQGQPYAEEAPDSNPFGLTFDGVDVVAVDAGGNDVLRIAPDGTTTVDHVLPGGMAEAPPFLGMPPGSEIPYQPVPTAVDLDEDGIPLVGQLTGFPFPVGEANVYDVSGDDPVVREGGFTNIIDIDVAPDGTLYVLEFADNGLLSDPPAPALVQVRTDGTRKHLLYGDELPVPGGVEVGPDGMVYLSVCTLCGPGGGMVWQIDPDVASDPATADACPPADVPGSTFPDIAPSVHRAAIECMAWWDAVNGFADGTYGPQTTIRRDQVASMMARALETAGVELPTDPPNAFTDDEGNFHEANINALAELGIVRGQPDGTFGPSDPVKRDQIASFFARAWEVVTGEALAAGPDAFTDDEGNIHEDNINAVAAAGWVRGDGEGSFNPSAGTTRAQFASILARMLSTMVADGHATVPGEDPPAE